MLNVIILAGNAVADPVVRTTNTGKNIATVRLAVNNPLNDEEVLYIDVDTWDKQSEFVQKFVKKGNNKLCTKELVSNYGTDVVLESYNQLRALGYKVNPLTGTLTW